MRFMRRAFVRGQVATPNFSNVVAQLHFNVSDGLLGVQPFIDATGRTWTAYNGAVISTAQSKFGGSSGLFVAASSQFIKANDSTDWDFGAGDFTIEAWLNLSSTGGYQQIVGQRAEGGTSDTDLPWGLTVGPTGIVYASRYISGPTATVMAGANSVFGSFKHVAFVRSGNVFTLYMNGAVEATATQSGSLSSSTTPLCIGRAGNYPEQYMNGYIDEVRVTKGHAWYTGAFTPPVAPFPDY